MMIEEGGGFEFGGLGRDFGRLGIWESGDGDKMKNWAFFGERRRGR